MSKNIKYLAAVAFLVGFIFVAGNIALAAGSACGVSSEGKCKTSCEPYDDVIADTQHCLTSKGEQCCVKTVCSWYNNAIGDCKGSGSCAGGYNTSDCFPPKICCPGEGGRGQTTGTTGNGSAGSSQVSPFTGEQGGGSAGQTEGLVPCEGFDCTLCSFFKLLKNIINFLTEGIFALAAGFVVWGAIEIMTAGGSEEKVKSGRGRVTTAVYGIVIALGAWLFIGTVLQVLTGSSSALPWNKIECSSKPLKIGAPASTQKDDSGCLSQGGRCQNKSVTCEGTYKSGLCLSSSDPNYLCCVSKFGGDGSSGGDFDYSGGGSGGAGATRGW